MYHLVASYKLENIGETFGHKNAISAYNHISFKQRIT